MSLGSLGIKRQCHYAPVDLHFNERVKDLDKFVNVDRLKKDLQKNASFDMTWKIKVKNEWLPSKHLKAHSAPRVSDVF